MQISKGALGKVNNMVQKQLSAAAALFLVGFAFCWGVAEADQPRRPLSFPSDKVSIQLCPETTCKCQSKS